MINKNPKVESDPEVVLRLRIDTLKMNEVIKNIDPDTLQDLFNTFMCLTSILITLMKKLLSVCVQGKRVMKISPVTQLNNTLITPRPVNKFIDLFDPKFIEVVKSEFKEKVKPFLLKGTPSMDPMRIIDFRMRELDVEGNNISKLKVYDAFKTLKPYLRKDLTKADYARYLSEKVLGFDSASSWNRCL